jgi:signal transduction histidine kinase/CheY-like chemotaxis protein
MKLLEMKQKEYEIQLKSMQTYERLYTNAPVVFFSMDPKSFSILNYNIRAMRLLDVDEKELIGKNFIDLFDEDCRERLQIALQQLQGDFFSENHGSYLTITKDETRYFSIGTSTIVDNELPRQSVILHNVTQIYKSTKDIETLNEGLIVAKERAEEATVAKSQFLASVSHELRTPLHGIICCTDLLSDTSLTSDQRSFVKVVAKSSTMLLDLISNILDFSRIEAGKLELSEKEFNFKECLQNIITTMNMSIKKKTKQDPLVVELDSDPNISEYMIGDEMRFTQVLVNLLGNAIKFSNDTGKILVRVGFVQDEGNEQDEAEIRIDVTDNGIGIPLDRRNELFKRFAQVDSAGSRSGAGLGLAICKTIVEKMGGRIWIEESTMGEGSTFSFTCKMKPFHHQVIQTTSIDYSVEDSFDLSNARILVAEDNSVNRKVMSAMLNGIGIQEYTLTCNGQEAVEAYKTSDYHLVLMDLNMPILGGIEATKLIRTYEDDNLKRKAVVIAVTANASDLQREECLAAGMTTFVTKPIRKQVLRRVIAKSLRNNVQIVE